MLKRYIGVTALEYDVVVLCECSSGNKYVIEALNSNIMYGTNNERKAIKAYENIVNKIKNRKYK